MSGLNEPLKGPDAMYSEDLPPSRGQYQAIATAALALLDVELPKSRLAATRVLTRLHEALSRDERRPLPPEDPIGF